MTIHETAVELGRDIADQCGVPDEYAEYFAEKIESALVAERERAAVTVETFDGIPTRRNLAAAIRGGK